MDRTALYIEWQKRLRPLLSLPGAAYAALMGLRRQVYRNGVFRSWRPPVPCISVGNIGWGGSGKTPLCGWLLDWLTDKGLKPVLLTRGYKSRPPKLPFLVSADSSPVESGDEPLLLARSCPDAAVLVDPNRARAGQWALDRLSPDVFVLDDGFQHLAVQRDLDLVLLRPIDLTHEWNRVLPAGSWREGSIALNNATAFSINCEADRFHTLKGTIEQRLSPFAKPVFSFFLETEGFLDGFGRRDAGMEAHRCCLVTGIADPDKALDAATRALGAPPCKHLVYPDHHPFQKSDWDHIVSTAEKTSCRTILCTPKDFVKLASLGDERLRTFDLTLRFGPSLLIDHSFEDWIDSQWRSLSSK